jgi:hypothetical protein
MDDGPMHSDDTQGDGQWAVVFAAAPPARLCGDGGDTTQLTRNEGSGGPGRGDKIAEYSQLWNKFSLADPAPDCGVIVIQRIVVSATVETTANTPPVTLPTQGPLAYYEVIGVIPPKQKVLPKTDRWSYAGAIQFQPPTPRLTWVSLSQSGFAVAFENTAALQAEIANWHPLVLQFGPFQGASFPWKSGTFPASKDFDPSQFQVFADEDAWHQLEVTWSNPPRKNILTVDGHEK